MRHTHTNDTHTPLPEAAVPAAAADPVGSAEDGPPYCRFNTVEEAWNDYADATFPEGLAPAAMDVLRLAFFCGAATGAALVTDGAKLRHHQLKLEMQAFIAADYEALLREHLGLNDDDEATRVNPC